MAWRVNVNRAVKGCWVKMSLRLPDFVVIGAAKAGTTSLYALLDRHPDIFMPTVKEPEFFARDELYAKGLPSYAQAYEAAKPGQTVGEASTLYSLSPLFPDTASRIAQHIPHAKLVYVLREPVGRAYSYYVQIIKNYQNVTGDPSVNRTFESFIDPEFPRTPEARAHAMSQANAHLPDSPDLCVAGSDYVHQIETYLAHFPRTQILFLKFEDFVKDREGALRQITDFLELSPLDPSVFDEDGVTRNVAQAHFDSWSDRVYVDQMRSQSGPLWALRQALPKRLRMVLKTWLLRKKPGNASIETHIPPPMLPQTADLLYERFAAQRGRLVDLTGLEFKEWDR